MRTKVFLFLIMSCVVVQSGAAFAAGAQPGISNSIPVIGEAPAVTAPEIAAPVELSSSDINRLVCPEDITDVIYSKEKGVTVKIEGKNAFVKFLVKEDGGQEDYSTTPTEIYVVCGHKTFNLIALPKRIPSRTVILSGGDDKAKRNMSFFEGMPFEKKVLSLIKSVYTENIPDSYTVTWENRPFNLYKGLKLTLVRTVRIYGEGLQVKEFALKALENMELSEKDFLKPELTANPVAIAIDKLRLAPGDVDQSTARVIIVEHVTEGGD